MKITSHVSQQRINFCVHQKEWEIIMWPHRNGLGFWIYVFYAALKSLYFLKVRAPIGKYNYHHIYENTAIVDFDHGKIFYLLVYIVTLILDFF